MSTTGGEGPHWSPDSTEIYDINPKTGKFAMLRPAGQAGAPAPRVRVIVNWLEEFRRGPQAAGL